MNCLLLTLGVLGVLMTQAAAIDQVFGAIAPTDSLLGRENIKRAFRLGRVITYDYTYTYTGNAVPPPTVTGVKIFDNKKIKNPTATIVGGGIGSATITIRFTSQRSLGIDSTVEVYGA